MARQPRFTPEKLDAALIGVCRELGVDHHGARLLRFTNNAVYALASIPAVVRIVGSQALRHRVHKVVRVAEHFARHGVPAVRLFPGVRQPIVAGDGQGLTATVWQYVPPSGPPPKPADLGRLLRQVHALPDPGGVGGWTPLDDVRARLHDAEELDPDDRQYLTARVAEVQEQLRTLQFPLGRGLLHGDAHLGNVLRSADGPLLCDFDSAAIGPRVWDLVPVATGVQRFGEPMSVYQELAAEYGFDVLDWPGYPALRATRELKLTTSVLPTLRSNPDVRPEFQRRLADLRAGRQHTRWARYQ